MSNILLPQNAVSRDLVSRWGGEGDAGKVVTPPEVPGVGLSFLVRDLTTTRVPFSFSPGARVVVVSFRLLPGATSAVNQFAKLVVNATSDADAAGKLATDGAFIPIVSPDDVILSFAHDGRCTRLDVLTDVALGGSEKNILHVRGVV